MFIMENYKIFLYLKESYIKTYLIKGREVFTNFKRGMSQKNWKPLI